MTCFGNGFIDLSRGARRDQECVFSNKGVADILRLCPDLVHLLSFDTECRARGSKIDVRPTLFGEPFITLIRTGYYGVRHTLGTTPFQYRNQN
jgi:hypothetical protein